MRQFVQRLKFVTMKDILAVFPMLASYIVSLFFRLKHKNVWLVCERRQDARDNGYWFFKYLCEKHKEIEAVYAIDFDSPDYSKVAALGKVIPFGTFIHWVYYWTAERNVSSQKEGKPNAALCYILEVYLGCRKNRAYIRHGIAKDDQRWVYYDVTKMNLFVTSVKREYDYVCKRFGYPKGNVQLVGLCRFDNLLTPHEVKRQIIVMPTMREWLRVMSNDTLKYENTTDFTKSEYYITWTSLLSNSRLSQILNKFKVQLLFFPHASMQQYVKNFKSVSNFITIADAKHFDVQQLLMDSALLITDYSSIYMDFAFMKKPLLYYHFDYEKYRMGQYQNGYFSYENDGFGDIVKDENELLDKLESILENNIVMPDLYQERVNGFFTFHDNKNCERTYNAIMNM